MKLYPPYKNWKAVINKPEKFRQFLEENIEVNNSNHSAPYKGKLSAHEFLIERKLEHSNTARPKIRGVIDVQNCGKQIITLSIESRRSLLYVIGVFAIIMLATAFSRSNPLVLLGIPISAIWFYLGGLVLHNMELKNTKAELEKILGNAQKN